MRSLLRNDYVIAFLVFLAAFIIFKSSRLHPINDSKYSMMLSQCLISNHTFKMDSYGVPRLTPLVRADYVQDGDIYQLEYVREHLYYFFPPGSSVLSVPFVMLANAIGISPVNSDGTFNIQGETKIEAWLAAFLMALLAASFYLTARVLLTANYSLLIVAGGAFGTQIWSTASRALFTDTWASLLLAFVIFRVLAFEVKGDRLRPLLLATLLAWAYFVYPSYSVHVAAISVYLLFRFSLRQLLAYALSGLVWIATFIIYSRYNFGTFVPSYFRPGRLTFGKFWTAICGNLFSPSRGFLIFVPTTIFVAYLLISYRQELRHRRLIILALSAIGIQLIMISGFDHWWGGHSYGPRLMTAFVPWLVLLAILGLRAKLNSRPGHHLVSRFAAAAGVLLLGAAIFIHARGAVALPTLIWNTLPENVDLKPERIWDWRQPQFLAGLILPPLPDNVAVLPEEMIVDFGTAAANPYLWYGWSIPEKDSRWTSATRATLIFAVKEVKPLTVKFRMAPFLAPPRLLVQDVSIALNGKLLSKVSLREATLTDVVLPLPRNQLRAKNVIEFYIPAAAVPATLGINEDQRQLGIRVASMELLRTN